MGANDDRESLWEESFVAMSALLGESIEDAIGALPPESVDRVAGLRARLAHPDKAARAKAIAQTLQPVLRALAQTRLR